MLEPTPTTKFKKDLKRFQHQKNIIRELHNIISLLLQRKSLERKHLDHPLGGNWKGSRECHVGCFTYLSNK